MNKALFIDRDGTINHDCPYCKDPRDLKIYPDAVALMKDYQEKGFLIIIVTNQSGIGRGYFSEKEMQKFNDHLLDELSRMGVEVDAIYHCPHMPGASCNCRKPKPGMILEAAEDFDIDLNSSFIVGDKDSIEGELARTLGMQYTILKREE